MLLRIMALTRTVCRRIRWSWMGGVTRIMAGLAEKPHDFRTIMIDASYLKAHRMASSLQSKRVGTQAEWLNAWWWEHEASRRYRQH